MIRRLLNFPLWLLPLLLWLTPRNCSGQTVSYFNQGFLRQPDAASDRAYLGITPSWINSQVTPTNAGPWQVSGNDIWWVRATGQAWIGDGFTTNINLHVTGDAEFAGNVHVNSLHAAKDITTDGYFDGDGTYISNIVSATYASIATNWLGSNAMQLQINACLTNLPSGVLTNNWNGPTIVITNSSLLVTGAQYIALSNNTSKVLMTNGTITASGIIQTTGTANLSGNNVGGTSFYPQSTIYGVSGGDLFFTLRTDNKTFSFRDSSLTNYSLVISTNGVTVGKTLIVTNSITSLWFVTATNYICSRSKWIDAPGQTFGALPAGSLKAIIPTVDMGDGTYAYCFTRVNGAMTYGKELLIFNCEAPHTISTTNAVETASVLYVEPHFHGRPLTAPVAPNTNVCFQIIYKGVNPGGVPSTVWTNNITYGLTAGSTNELLIEFGHNYWTNFIPSIAAVWPCTITVQSAANPYIEQLGSGFIVRQPSIHVPIGNTNAIGASFDNAP